MNLREGIMLLGLFGLVWGSAAHGGPPDYSAIQGAYYFRYNSGERWEKYSRVGDYSDVMVRLGPGDARFIFWRGSSYRPFLETESGREFVSVEVPQDGDGEGMKFDKTNKHSHVRIVERSPARVIVEWRYPPDFDKTGPQWWTEEYFTVYPDGVCYRSVNTGTETLEKYEDPSHADVYPLLLTRKGVTSMPEAWAEPIRLIASEPTLEDYKDLGFNRTRGHYAFRAKEAGRPSTIRFKVTSFVRNPALMVKRWGVAGVKVRVNGNDFDLFKRGHARKMNNNHLVVWLNGRFKKGTEVTLEPVGESEPIDRRPAPDPYAMELHDLPPGSPDPGPFGAYYTTLKYWELWDKERRVGEYADAVVQFDQSADRLVFWRGATFVPHWVNEKNHWYNNEFVERRGDDFGLDDLCEPMSDFDCKFSRARILHSSPARAVVHWRYAPVTADGHQAAVDERGWGDRVDEYYYVYPDESCVRYANLYTSAPNMFHEWHEAIPVTNPGSYPEDVIETNALSVANNSGETISYNFEDGFPPNTAFKDDYNIVLVGLKGKSDPYAICESTHVWWDPISRPGDTRFNQYDDWPGWPAKYRGSDWEKDPETGYERYSELLPSHSSLMHLNWDNYESDYDKPLIRLSRVMLNGMTRKDDVSALVPRARYWENPPTLKVEGYGYSGGVFDKAQKAYIIEKRVSWDADLINRDDDKLPNKKPDEVTLKVTASQESPVVNPCFVIKDWPEEKRCRVYIDGKEASAGKQFRQGIERTWKGELPQSDLIVWIRDTSKEPVNYTVKMDRE